MIKTCFQRVTPIWMTDFYNYTNFSAYFNWFLFCAELNLSQNALWIKICHVYFDTQCKMHANGIQLGKKVVALPANDWSNFKTQFETPFTWIYTLQSKLNAWKYSLIFFVHFHTLLTIVEWKKQLFYIKVCKVCICRRTNRTYTHNNHCMKHK